MGEEHGPEFRGGEPWKNDSGIGLRVTGMKEEFDKNLKSPRGKSGAESWSQAITKETARRKPDPKEDIMAFMWL